MNQRKYFAGIDIGTTKIVAIIGCENQYSKLEILGYGKAKSQGIFRGMVGNIGKTIDAIEQAVARAMRPLIISHARMQRRLSLLRTWKRFANV